jgi:foldase protein PrsA
MHREATRLGAAADTTAIQQRLAELQTQYGGAAKLDTALKQAGLSRDQLRRSISDGVLREALRDAKFSGTRATPEALSAYYRRNVERLFTRPATVHLGAIQVRTKGVARNAIARLHAGRPFSEVARQLTTDPQSRDEGGDLGWVALSSLPGPLKAAVDGSGVGVIPTPLNNGNVWYVLNVFAERAARVMPFSTIRDRLAAELTAVERSKQLQRWLTRAREQADVVTP